MAKKTAEDVKDLELYACLGPSVGEYVGIRGFVISFIPGVDGSGGKHYFDPCLDLRNATDHFVSDGTRWIAIQKDARYKDARYGG